MKTIKVFILSLLMGATLVLNGQELDMSKLNGLNFRNIGPAGMSGRVTAIDVVNTNKSIIYLGSATGGVWKSENNGINFKPIFDDQKSASIGDIAIYQKNPNIIYVGTGEGNPRNSQSAGNGMYKSIDGGNTWEYLGLEGTKNIHRVIVHPENPEIVYVGAIGTAWGPSEERGVFKSLDGGKTWVKILYTNETTGVADMVMDPSNPNKLIVAMWDYQRWPWFFRSGGEGSAIHMTMDGGANWSKQSAMNGLPKGELGRIGLSISPSNSKVVYALVEAKENALFRSDNGGQMWRKVTTKGVGDRPFYYSDIEVDPSNENRIYHIATSVSMSEDGGKTFKDIMGFFSVHSDHHAWWINPDDPNHILDGNDGGLYATWDRGKTWKFHHNLPLGQFYHISVDNEIPYNVLGGLQDNGSWSGPAYKWEMFGAINNKDFTSVGFGDGFDVISDPDDSRFGYSLWQGGNFQRYDKKTGVTVSLSPRLADSTVLRYNWNAGIAVDPFDNSTVYIGSQFVHKSTNKGYDWKIISPDLTTNDPEKQKQFNSGGLTIDNTTAENHCSILVIEPSTIKKGLIWVGTDDGNIQITQDGGNSWKNVQENIKGLPANSWCCQIKASTYKEGEAFAVFDDHRRDNWEPYVFKTSDFGKTWKRIVDANDVWGYALSIVQDPVEANLFFLGTEFGLYVSIDGANTWTKWKKDFPTTSAMDMVIHPREHDLVVGTFGRSVWVLDDIRPLRELASKSLKVTEKEIHLFEPPTAYLPILGLPAFFQNTGDRFAGTNRMEGALLSYWSSEASKKDSVRIEIRDASGEIFRTINTTAKPGLNRIAWNIRRENVHLPGPPDPFAMLLLQGVEALPGTYSITLISGDNESTQSLTLKSDPKMEISSEDLATSLKSKQRYHDNIARFTKTYKKLQSGYGSIQKIEAFLKDNKDENAILEDIKELKAKYKKLEADAMPTVTKGIVGDTKDLKTRLGGELGMFYMSALSKQGSTQTILMDKIEKQLDIFVSEVNVFVDEDIEKFKTNIDLSKIKW